MIAALQSYKVFNNTNLKLKNDFTNTNFKSNTDFS